MSWYASAFGATTVWNVATLAGEFAGGGGGWRPGEVESFEHLPRHVDVDVLQTNVNTKLDYVF